MKTCSITCIVASVILLSNIVMTYLMSVNSTMKQYEIQLPPELIEKYKEIADNRKQIYFTGYMLGFVLSCVLIFTLYYSGKSGLSVSLLSMVCFTLVVSYLTSVAYYVFSPKKDWMLNHIKDEKQAKAWLHMYQYMKNTYHTSFGVGLFGVLVFLFSFRCNKFAF